MKALIAAIESIGYSVSWKTYYCTSECAYFTQVKAHKNSEKEEYILSKQLRTEEQPNESDLHDSFVAVLNKASEK